jgi:hypothetical protein
MHRPQIKPNQERNMPMESKKSPKVKKNGSALKAMIGGGG